MLPFENVYWFEYFQSQLFDHATSESQCSSSLVTKGMIRLGADIKLSKYKQLGDWYNTIKLNGGVQATTTFVSKYIMCFGVLPRQQANASFFEEICCRKGRTHTTRNLNPAPQRLRGGGQEGRGCRRELQSVCVCFPLCDGMMKPWRKQCRVSGNHLSVTLSDLSFNPFSSAPPCHILLSFTNTAISHSLMSCHSICASLHLHAVPLPLSLPVPLSPWYKISIRELFTLTFSSIIHPHVSTPVILSAHMCPIILNHSVPENTDNLCETLFEGMIISPCAHLEFWCHFVAARAQEADWEVRGNKC